MERGGKLEEVYGVCNYSAARHNGQPEFNPHGKFRKPVYNKQPRALSPGSEGSWVFIQSYLSCFRTAMRKGFGGIKCLALSSLTSGKVRSGPLRKLSASHCQWEVKEACAEMLELKALGQAITVSARGTTSCPESCQMKEGRKKIFLSFLYEEYFKVIKKPSPL